MKESRSPPQSSRCGAAQCSPLRGADTGRPRSLSPWYGGRDRGRGERAVVGAAFPRPPPTWGQRGGWPAWGESPDQKNPASLPARTVKVGLAAALTAVSPGDNHPGIVPPE